MRESSRNKPNATDRGMSRPLTPGKYNRQFQVIGTVDPGAGSDPLRSARDVVLRWVRQKKRWQVTAEQATAGRPIHLEDEDSLRSLSIESAPGLWAIRLDDPCSQVPGRQWRVELAFVDQPGDRPAFGCTLSVMIPPNLSVTGAPGLPAVIRDLARTQGLQEGGRNLDGALWEIDRPHEVDDLVQYLESPQRTSSVLVVSRSRNAASFGEAAKLAERLAGLTVVATCTPEAADELTDRYGRELGVFGDAMRLYRVDFDPDVDESKRHPLYRNPWNGSLAALTRSITSIAMFDTVGTKDETRDLPSFGLIRQIAAKQRVQAALSETHLSIPAIEELREDLEKLQKDREEWRTMALDEEKLAKSATTSQQQTQARLYVYAERIRLLEERLSAGGLTTKPAIPDSLADISNWCESHLAGRLVLTPRALREVSRVDHAEPQKIYQALLLLATEYWNMKTHGGGRSKTLFDEAALRIGVRVGPTGDAVRQQRYSDEYQVRWEGNSYPLDLHLAGSDSRDIRRGLRVYFAWEEAQQLVLVGHLPTHLTNTLT